MPANVRRRSAYSTRSLALGTLLVVAVLGPALYAWHAYQVHRTARAFLERADQLEADQDWTTAASYLHRYLSLQPEDSAARIRMAKTFDRGAKDWQQKSLAVNLYYDTLGLIPEKEQAAPRRRLAELLLEIRRFTAAEAEATKLLAADDKDPQGRRLLALALYAQVQSGAAVAKPKGSRPINQVFESALQDNPGDVQLSAIFARIYRSDEQLLDGKKRAMRPAEREKQADLLMDQMIHANPASPDAYLARYAYRAQYRLPGADEDLPSGLEAWTGQFGRAAGRRGTGATEGQGRPPQRVFVLGESSQPWRAHSASCPRGRAGLSPPGRRPMGIEKSATRGRNVAMRLEEGERREYSPAPASGGGAGGLGTTGSGGARAGRLGRDSRGTRQITAFRRPRRAGTLWQVHSRKMVVAEGPTRRRVAAAARRRRPRNLADGGRPKL